MGLNTTMIILNDALDEILKDKGFGEKVYAAIQSLEKGKQVKIGSGCFVNAATVVETHHSDFVKLIAVGGNCAQVLGHGGGYCSTPEEILKNLANSLGYNLVKKN